MKIEPMSNSDKFSKVKENRMKHEYGKLQKANSIIVKLDYIDKNVKKYL